MPKKQTVGNIPLILFGLFLIVVPHFLLGGMQHKIVMSFTNEDRLTIIVALSLFVWGNMVLAYVWGRDSGRRS